MLHNMGKFTGALKADRSPQDTDAAALIGTQQIHLKFVVPAHRSTSSQPRLTTVVTA